MRSNVDRTVMLYTGLLHQNFGSTFSVSALKKQTSGILIDRTIFLQIKERVQFVLGQDTIQNYDSYSSVAPQPSSLHLSLTLWLISGMHAFIWTSYSFFFFFLRTKKVSTKNLWTCQHASINIECLSQNQVLEKKKRLVNTNPRTYKYDSELIWKHSNNGVQT